MREHFIIHLGTPCGCTPLVRMRVSRIAGGGVMLPWAMSFDPRKAEACNVCTMVEGCLKPFRVHLSRCGGLHLQPASPEVRAPRPIPCAPY